MTRRPPPFDSTGQRGFRAVGALLACMLLWPGASQAQETTERLKDVEQALEASESERQSLGRRADELQQEISALQDKSIEAAEKIQDLESQLTRIETMLQDLEIKHETKTAELKAQHGNLYQTLAALQRIAVQPTEAVLVSRGTPVERVRSALLLNAAIPAIEERAAGLRDDLEELSSLRLSIEQQHFELAATAEALADERRLLGELIGRKKGLHAETLGERESVESNAELLAVEAKNLRDLLARLEEQSRLRAEQEARARVAEQLQAQAEVKAQKAQAALEAQKAQAALEAQKAQEESQPESAAPAFVEEAYEGTRSLAEDIGEGEATGESEDPALASLTPGALERPDTVRAFPQGDAIPLLIMPVRGQLVLAYGQRAIGADSVSKGISIQTRTQAQVVAPYDGQIVYAGEFRGYGQILIIEHGGRYHTLLAGLERIDAGAGQWILAGEPIGVMGSSQEQIPELYLELRHAGQPVNPLPWLATTDDKVQG
jgi:septal ring factor EnvC (AmiA/AmiB activator)